MTFDEAIMFLLHNPEGPFPPAVWAQISYLFKTKEQVMENWEMEDFFNRLPVEVQCMLNGHYIGLQLKIRFELDLLGIKVFGLDFSDCNYWLEFWFEDWESLRKFSELVELDSYPSGVDWVMGDEPERCIRVFCEDHEGVPLFMPRMDAYPVLQMLQRLTAVVVSDEDRASVLAEHEQRRNGQKIQDWG